MAFRNFRDTEGQQKTQTYSQNGSKFQKNLDYEGGERTEEWLFEIVEIQKGSKKLKLITRMV